MKSIKPKWEQMHDVLEIHSAFVPFTHRVDKSIVRNKRTHRPIGKHRPVVLLGRHNGKAKVYEITSKYYSKNKYDRKWEFPIKNWKKLNFKKPSYVKLDMTRTLPNKQVDGMIIGFMPFKTAENMLDKSIHLQTKRLQRTKQIKKALVKGEKSAIYKHHYHYYFGKKVNTKISEIKYQHSYHKQIQRHKMRIHKHMKKLSPSKRMKYILGLKQRRMNAWKRG